MLTRCLLVVTALTQPSSPSSAISSVPALLLAAGHLMTLPQVGAVALSVWAGTCSDRRLINVIIQGMKLFHQETLAHFANTGVSVTVVIKIQ
jgi:hypothetical protein